jgi:hypothetical protein
MQAFFSNFSGQASYATDKKASRQEEAKSVLPVKRNNQEAEVEEIMWRREMRYRSAAGGNSNPNRVRLT